MSGDSEAIGGLARTMREQGVRLHDEADALLAWAEATPWEGLAADALRLRARARAAALHGAAGLADDAAAALARHAAEVDRRVRLAGAAGHALLGQLTGGLRGLVP